MAAGDPNVFAIAVALLAVAWLGFQVMRGLRTGFSHAAGFRFSRAERPKEFWLILAVQILVILVLLAVIALELGS